MHALAGHAWPTCVALQTLQPTQRTNAVRTRLTLPSMLHVKVLEHVCPLTCGYGVADSEKIEIINDHNAHFWLGLARIWRVH